MTTTTPILFRASPSNLSLSHYRLFNFLIWLSGKLFWMSLFKWVKTTSFWTFLLKKIHKLLFFFYFFLIQLSLSQQRYLLTQLVPPLGLRLRLIHPVPKTRSREPSTPPPPTWLARNPPSPRRQDGR